MILEYKGAYIQTLKDTIYGDMPFGLTQDNWVEYIDEVNRLLTVLMDPTANIEEDVAAMLRYRNSIHLQYARDVILKAYRERLSDGAKDDYTPESWNAYEAALREAIAVVEDPKSTDSNINDVINKVDITSFDLKLKKSAVVEILKQTLTWNETGFFTRESWTVYIKAVHNVIAVFNNVNSDDEDIDDAIDEARQAFYRLKINTNINSIEKCLEEVLKENKDGIYTKESWSIYEKAVDTVIDLLKADEIDEDILIDAYVAMEEAYDQLILENKTPVVKPEKPGNDKKEEPQKDVIGNKDKDKAKNPVKTGDCTDTNALASTLIISGIAAVAAFLKRKKQNAKSIIRFN